MVNRPLVSVVIPNYNHAPYLEKRLTSVLNQTYQNYEVIILDDNSTDDSLDVINRFWGDPHIREIIVNDVNSGGTFKQWSKGIELAAGDLIWIAESDDYCEPTLLEELVAAYTKHKGTTLAYSTLVLVNENEEPYEYGGMGKNQYFAKKQYVRRYLTLANFVRNASCAVFSAEAARNIPLDYQNYKGAGDYLFWVEIALSGRVAIVNKRLSYFRRHSGVVTDKRDLDGTNFNEEKKILDYIRTKLHISWLRMQGIMCYHQNRVLNTQYASDEIREQLIELWHVPKRFNKFQKYIWRTQAKYREKYNYYL